MSRTPAWLLTAGLLVMSLAVAWWWLTYREVVQYSYISGREAGICLMSNSSICDLARSLCRSTHPISIAGYWSGTFWIGAVMVSASLLMADRRRA